MKIRVLRQGVGHWLLQFILLITMAQSTLAGQEIYYDGKKFFYRVNGKDIPIDVSPGAEIIQLQRHINYPQSRKPREAIPLQDAVSVPKTIRNDLWSSDKYFAYNDSMENPELEYEESCGLRRLGEPGHGETRYDVIIRYTKLLNGGKPEENIRAAINIIKLDIETHFFHSKFHQTKKRNSEE